jgi:hypothetical protein
MQMPWIGIQLKFSFLQNLSHYHSINMVVSGVGGVLMEQWVLWGGSLEMHYESLEGVF